MGGLTSAVHWWEESQMRVLVLSSLIVQFLLYILTLFRNRGMPGLIRSVMWLAYLGGDAIAVYALATLFNRHKDQDRGGKNTLEVVWAPILLLHLGGPDGITAYNIEDNELWTRHLLTAVSQVTVAIYVFCKSWPPGADRRLLQASILLFVPGVVKCFAKPWALKSASFTSLVSLPAAKRTARKKDQAGETDLHSLEKYVKGAKAFVDNGETDPHSLETYVEGGKAFVQERKDEDNEAQVEGACVDNGDRPPPQQGKQNKDEMDPFEEYVRQARGFVVGEQEDDEGGAHRKRQQILNGEAHKLFVDISSPPYAVGRRLSIFKYFWVLISQGKAETAYGNVRRGLASAFLRLYTKLKIATSPGIGFEIMYNIATARGRISSTRFVVEMVKIFATLIGFYCRILITASRLYLPWAAIGLFHKSHREAYDDTDAKITYAILCCTAVLELFSAMSVFYTEFPKNVAFYIISGEQWPEKVAQYSLIGYFARNKNHGKLMWIARYTGCKDLVDRHWCMQSCSSSRRITELVLGYLRDGWEQKIGDVASYRSFIDHRGQWTLEDYKHELGWSIEAPFDESVLLWHIATDFCCFSWLFSEQRRTCDFNLQMPTKAVQCREMSNYMVYLLFVNPEMLLPGARRNLFKTAYKELKDILGDNNLNRQSCCCCCQKVVEEGLMKTLIRTMEDKSKNHNQDKSKEGQLNGGSEGNFIDDAWHLAQGLLKLRDDFGEEKMWEVIQRVWVEMLCFSASRCRGYLHAKALGSGGEFLSYVWLLLFYMGMETFTERLQREELPSREANKNGDPPRPDAHNGNTTTSSLASQNPRSGSSSPSHLDPGASASNFEIRIAMQGLTSGPRGG